MTNNVRSAPLQWVGLVEDEPVLREELTFQLQHRGFNVLAFEDATALYRHLATGSALAALVLDIGLPGENGLSVAQLLRQHHPLMGLVFVTARHLRDQRLEGLAAGADGYLTKPVDMDELDLLLRRLLERHTHTTLFTQAATPFTLPPTLAGSTDALGWQLHHQQATLHAPNGCQIRLTLTEWQLLTALLAAPPGQPRAHAELAHAIHLMSDEWNRHRLEVIVSRLRAKVERESGLAAPVGTVRGVGYIWNAH